MKNKTIAQVAQERSFEDIYAVISQKKVDLDVVVNDIKTLQNKASILRSAISHENQIALTKRKALINKQ